MDLKFDGHVKLYLIVNRTTYLILLLICLFISDVLPTFIGKMYINSLNDLTKITSLGSKILIVDELNDFAENGRLIKFLFLFVL